MKRAVPIAFALLALSVTFCRAQPAEGADPRAAQVERQILVMLKLPAPHLRPGTSYAGSYDVGAGREARRRIAMQLARAHALELVTDWPMPSLGIDCFVMQVAPGVDPAQAAAEVARDARADWAQPMGLFRSLGHDDPLYALQPAASAWHLADLHRLATGRRVLIAELDSGVESNHPDLAGQVQAAENFVPGDASPGEAHGTAVAGVVAAIADNHAGIVGVAPGARLLALRACWQHGDAAACSSFTLARALQFALDRDAHVINLSITGPQDRLLQQLLDVAVARGITVVAAIDPGSPQGGFPASHPGVLAIASDDAGTTRWLSAPGNDVPTTLPGARWGLVSGSSFAAAHVSGLVALIKELAPSLSARQVREAVTAVAANASQASDPPHLGRIDACAVFARLTGACTCSCMSAAQGASASNAR
jgi:subtilisin family serine protease